MGETETNQLLAITIYYFSFSWTLVTSQGLLLLSALAWTVLPNFISLQTIHLIGNNIGIVKQFNIDCGECLGISKHLEEVRCNYPDYHALPVPVFGSDKPRLLIVGLGSEMHGANATGRPFIQVRFQFIQVRFQ